MKNQKYTKELKAEVVNKYKNGIPVKTLAQEYNIKSVLSIYQWVNKSERERNQFGINNDLPNNLVEDVLSEHYKKEFEKTQRELQVTKARLEKKELEISFLKKHIRFESLEKNNEKEFAELSNLKKTKYEAYILIEANRNIFSVKFLCSILPVTEKSYYKWISNGKKEFVQKEDHVKNKKIIDSLKIHYDKGGLNTGAVKLQKMLQGYGVFGGKNKIRKLNKDLKGLKIFKNRSNSKKVGRDTHEKFIRKDIIVKNFTTNESLEKVGFDGTWVWIKINGIKRKILLEIAFDWFDKKIIGFAWGYSENTAVVLKTLNQVQQSVKAIGREIIVQCDRGRANCSQAVLDFELASNLKISMSESGFKHNSITESLNGWFKEYLRSTIDLSFNSILEFDITIKKFVKKYNEMCGWGNIELRKNESKIINLNTYLS